MARLNLTGRDFNLAPGFDVSAGAGGGDKVTGAWGMVRKSSPDWQGVNQVQNKIRTDLEAQEIGINAGLEAQQIQLDATQEALDKQVKYASQQAKSAGSSAMLQGGIGAIASIGAALLSDETTKHDIQTLDSALATLRDLRPVTFYYNEEYSSSPERLHHGFIAQEYREVLPDATYFDESTGKFCIDTGDLIGILVRAVQELETRVMYMEATQALAGVK